MKRSSFRKIGLLVVIPALVGGIVSCAAPTGSPAGAAPAEEAAPAEAAASPSTAGELLNLTPLEGIYLLPPTFATVDDNYLFPVIPEPSLCKRDKSEFTPLQDLEWLDTKNEYQDGPAFTAIYRNRFDQSFAITLSAGTLETFTEYRDSAQVCLEVNETPVSSLPVAPEPLSEAILPVNLGMALAEAGYDPTAAAERVAMTLAEAYNRGIFPPEALSEAFVEGSLLPEMAREILAEAGQGNQARLEEVLLVLLKALGEEQQPTQLLVISVQLLDERAQADEYWVVHYVFDPPIGRYQTHSYKAKCQTSAWVDICAIAGSVQDNFWRYPLNNPSATQWIGSMKATVPYLSCPYGYLYSSSWPNRMGYDTSVTGLQSGSSYTIYGGWVIGYGGESTCQ